VKNEENMKIDFLWNPKENIEAPFYLGGRVEICMNSCYIFYMNVLFDIAFPSVTKYVCYASSSIVYSGNDYDNIVISVGDFTEGISAEKGYEVPQIEIKIDDPMGVYRAITIDTVDLYIANIVVVCRQGDGTAIMTLKVESWNSFDGKFAIKCSHKIDMNTMVPVDLINDTDWPNAHPDSIGKPVPRALNGVIIKAWKVAPSPSLYNWLLGDKVINTVTNVSIGERDSVNSTYWELKTLGGKYYLKMLHGVIIGSHSFCYVTVTTPTHTPVAMITDLLSGVVTVATNASFSTFLATQGYTTTKIKYILDKQMTVSNLLKTFSTSFECDWKFDASGEIEFVWIDRSNISTAYDFAQGELDTLIPQDKYRANWIENLIKYRYDWNNKDGVYDTDNGIYNGPNQSDWGIFERSFDYAFLNESVQAAVTATERYNLKKEPIAPYTMSCNIDTAITLSAGDLISITDNRLKTSNPILFQIRRRTISPMTNMATFLIWDINWLRPTWYWKANLGYVLANADKKVIISR
jgi:hypothetical protein